MSLVGEADAIFGEGRGIKIKMDGDGIILQGTGVIGVMPLGPNSIRVSLLQAVQPQPQDNGYTMVLGPDGPVDPDPSGQ